MKIMIEGVNVSFKNREDLEAKIREELEKLKPKKTKLFKKLKTVTKQERAFKKLLGQTPEVKKGESDETEKVSQ